MDIRETAVTERGLAHVLRHTSRLHKLFHRLTMVSVWCYKYRKEGVQDDDNDSEKQLEEGAMPPLMLEILDIDLSGNNTEVSDANFTDENCTVHGSDR